MKRIAIFLSGLLALPAFAEVAPVYLDDEIVYADAEFYDDFDLADDEVQDVKDTPSVKSVSKNASSRSVSSSRVKASRTVPSGAAAVSGRASNGAAARAVAARTTTNTSQRGTASRTATNRTAVTNRATTAGATRATVSRASASGAAARATGGAKTRSVSGRGTNSATRARASTLYTANSVGRVSVGSDNVMSGVRAERVGTNIRVPAIRSGSMTYTAANTNVSGGTTATSPSELDELAELTDYCKAQYANCMDNYCNVLDDNQGRCSCSANLKNYSKAETTLKQVTEELQDVAQKIKYIGLNTRDVETLFTQTEAELKMQSSTDNSNIKTSLDKIRNMIVDVQSGSSTGTTSTDVAFDLSGLLDFNIDSTGFDLSAFLGNFTTNTNTSSIKNQRGEQLYKTATARCKSNVLNSCVAQGVDAAIITNSYDLEIDKQCIAYERSLNDSNDQMAATVRNAKFVLQNARLLVSRQKNEYSDMRQCVSALDACMQDDFVCGSDYEKCLDPTGRYIVNGELVVGSQPGQAIDPNLSLDSAADSNVCKVNLYRTWDMPNGNPCSGSSYAPGVDQGNAWGTGSNDTLANYIDATVTDTAAQDGSVNMSKYLQNKIGYVNNNNGLNYGMCVSVLNKCQNYTYTGAGTNAKYNPKNDVIKQYLARVLVQIKAKQDEILNDYAANCVTDVTNCLNQNNYPTAALNASNNATNSVQQRVAINACRSNILTCMSVTGYSTENPTPTQLANWVYGILGQVQTTDSSNTYQGYVQNQLYVRYSCGVGSVAQDTSQQMVAFGELFQLRNDACQQQNGYECNYYWQDGTTMVQSSFNYPYQVSKIIEYRCTEQTELYGLSGSNLLSNIFDVNNDGHVDFVSNATLDVGVSTRSFTFNTNLFDVDEGYTCIWRYNGRNVRDGDTIEWDGSTKVTPTCNLANVNITYNCSDGTTNNATAQPNAQITLNGCNDVVGHTCHYEQSGSPVTSPASFNDANVVLSQECTPITYTVGVTCGDNTTGGTDVTTCTYGQACNLSGICTASNSSYELKFSYLGQQYDMSDIWNFVTGNEVNVVTIVVYGSEIQNTMLYRCLDGNDVAYTIGAASSNFVINGDACSEPAGYTYRYSYNGTEYGAGDTVAYNNSVNEVVQTRVGGNLYTVTIDCTDIVDDTGTHTQNVTFGSAYNIESSNQCTVSNGYTCSGYTITSGSSGNFDMSGTYNIPNDITVKPDCTGKKTYLSNVYCGAGTSNPNTTISGNTILTHGEVITAPTQCPRAEGYGTCAYVTNNIAIGTVGQPYEYVVGNYEAPTYKCYGNTYTLTFSCGDLPSNYPDDLVASFVYGGYGPTIPVTPRCNIDGYTCNGWVIQGTEDVYNGSLLTPSDTTVVPNCTPNE